MSDREAIKDILLKAAEDVQQGMWCQGALFAGKNDLYGEIFISKPALEEAQGKLRCAEGSVGLAAALQGFPEEISQAAILHVCETLPDLCDQPGPGQPDAVTRDPRPCDTLFHHNDHHMDDINAFEAGQHLAEIFRVAADRL